MADPAGGDKKDAKKFTDAVKKLEDVWDDIAKELPAAAKLRKSMDDLDAADEKKNAKVIQTIEAEITSIRKLLKDSDTGSKALGKLV